MPLFGGLFKRILAATVVAIVISSQAFSECSEPVAPVFPEFDANDLSVMDGADQSMQVYVNQTEEYLECLNEDQRKKKMDGVLARMKQVTANYNALANAYRKSKAEQLFSNSAE